MPTSSVARAFKVALMAAAVSSINDTTVTFSYGEPDTWSDDIVSLGRLTSKQAPATMGTNRSREETLTCEIRVISAKTAQVDADQRAYALIGLVENQVRSFLVGDTTLGGTVRDCFMTDHTSDGGWLKDDPTGRRVCDLKALFVAHVRISG